MGHTGFCKAPSGSRTHTSAMARQQATATSWAQKCITTKLSKINNAEASKEHRAGIEPASPRYDGGVLPLDHQCLFQNVSSGIGENRTHIARIKSPMHYLVCHNPMCCCSRRRRCFVSIGVAGIEPALRRLIRTPLSPLSYTPMRSQWGRRELNPHLHDAQRIVRRCPKSV